MAYRIEQTGAELQGILNDAAVTKQGLENEVARAQAAEGGLQENIDTEAGARQGADALLAGNIGTEVARAQQAESDLGVRIDANAAGVAAEVVRAQEAEGEVWDTLNDEILTRQSQDAALQGNIEREALLRENGDGHLQGEIDAISGKIPASASENNKLVDAVSLDAKIGGKADRATTLAGYGIEDAYTKDAVDEMVETLSRNEVVVGTLPQTGEEGVIYRVPGNGYYTDYMYYNGEFVELAQYSMEFDQTQVGYFTCDTEAGTAAKTVSAAGYTLAVGGNMRIKMANANTADGVLLDINGVRKPLFYDGVQASSANSWEAGEVLEVYYDGTQYQCASGGGGKFASGEKVSDVSINPAPTQDSGALTTSGALYDVYHSILDGGLYLNLESGTKKRAKISNTVWNVNGNYYCGFIPITAGKTYTIKANTEQACTYAFMTSDTVGSHTSAVTTFADGYTSTRSVAAGNSVDEVAPSDAQYIYIYRADVNSSTNTKFVPEYILQRNGMKYEGKDVTIDNSGTDFTSINLQSLLPELDIINKKVIDKSTFTRQYIGTYGLIFDANNYILSPPFIMYKGDTVTITGTASAFYNTRLHIVEYLGGYTKNLVAYNAGNMSYTAPDTKVIQVSCPPGATITIVRSDNRIEDIEKTNTDAIEDMYLRELIGGAISIPFTLNVGSYYKSSTLQNDSYMAYTSPIALKNGETIVLIEQYNRDSTDIFNLSDDEGNVLGVVSKIKSTYVPSDGIADYYNIYKYTAVADCYIVVSCLRTQTIYKEQSGEVQKYFNKVDAITESYDILDMYATRETENKLRQLTYGYNPSLGTFGNSTKPPLCLLHFSDIHANTVGDTGGLPSVEKNTKRIVQFYKKYESYITDVIHTGDSVYATAGGNFPWPDDEDVAKFLNVLGNHDIDGSIDGDYSSVAKYNKFFAPYISEWGVTQPDDAASSGKCYYYKDYASNGVRLIVLMNWTVATAGYMDAEYTWFESVLADARTQGLTVVCAGHVSPGSLTLIDGCTFNSWECAGHGDAGGVGRHDVFSEKVHSFIQAGGDFACWIGGHTHFDMTGTLTDYPEQLVILVENASCWSKWNADKRVAGTLSQDCFNIMSVDTILKRVNVMRIGSNHASAMQHKGAFSYDYRLHKLLNCY